jgi:outer membrane protein assembly factor BamB
MALTGAAVVAALAAAAPADDWPVWGGRNDRNMVSPETHLPDLADEANTPWQKLHETPLVRWRHKLEGTTYGTPTVAGGCVHVGTCLGKGADLREAVECLDEATGVLLWRWTSPVRMLIDPNRPAPHSYAVNDAPPLRAAGVCSSPAVEDGRVYFVSSRGKVVCLDADGAPPSGPGTPATATSRPAASQPGGAATSRPARVVWELDLWSDPNVLARPADLFSSSVLLHGQFVYVCTSNGVDQNWKQNKYPARVSTPSPEAPSLIALDKSTGRLAARDREGIGRRVYQGQWSSPSLGQAPGRTLVLYAGGDAVLYAFEALAERPGGVATLKKVWSFDCLPAEYKTRDANGVPVDFRLGDRDVKGSLNKGDGLYVGPSHVIATPVFHDGRVYVALGRDPRHGRGRGALHCIDAAKTGDITATGAVWSYRDIEWSISTVAVVGGLVYAGDVGGRLHCLDARTGAVRWVHGQGARNSAA